MQVGQQSRVPQSDSADDVDLEAEFMNLEHELGANSASLANQVRREVAGVYDLVDQSAVDTGCVAAHIGGAGDRGAAEGVEEEGRRAGDAAQGEAVPLQVPALPDELLRQGRRLTQPPLRDRRPPVQRQR